MVVTGKKPSQLTTILPASTNIRPEETAAGVVGKLVGFATNGPFEKAFATPAGTTSWTFLTSEIGNNTSLLLAKKIEMFVDGTRVKFSELTVAALAITTAATYANEVLFVIEF